MMKTTLRLVSLIGLLVLTAARLAAGSPDPRAAALAALDDQWSVAAGKKDAKAVASYYALDCVAYPPGSPMLHGRAEAEKMWGDAFADPAYKLSWKTTAVGVSASGETGYSAGTFEETSTVAGKAVTQVGKYLEVWRKDSSGQWKCIHDIWNYDK